MALTLFGTDNNVSVSKDPLFTTINADSVLKVLHPMLTPVCALQAKHMTLSITDAILSAVLILFGMDNNVFVPQTPSYSTTAAELAQLDLPLT